MDDINSVFGKLQGDLMMLLSDTIESVKNPEMYAKRKSKDRNKELLNGNNHFEVVFENGQVIHKGIMPIEGLHSFYGSIYLMEDMDTIKTYIDYIKGRLSLDYMMQDPFDNRNLESEGCLYPYYDKDHNSLFSINVVDCSKDNFERLKYGPYTNDDGTVAVGHFLESENSRSILNQSDDDAIESANKNLVNVDLNIFINFEKKPLSSVLSLIYTKQKSVNVIFAVAEAFNKLDIRYPWDLVHPIDVEDQYCYSKETVTTLLRDELEDRKMWWDECEKHNWEA